MGIGPSLRGGSGRRQPGDSATLARADMFQTYGCRAFLGSAPRNTGGAAQPRHAPRARLGRGGPGQPQCGGAARGDAPDPPDGEARMAGGMAPSRRHPDGPHHPLRRRHSRPGPAALRQGPAPGPGRPARGDGRRPVAHPSGCRLRLPHLRRDGARCARRLGDSGGGGIHRLSRRSFGVRAAHRRDSRIRGRRSRGDRRRHHPRPRAHRELACLVR